MSRYGYPDQPKIESKRTRLAIIWGVIGLILVAVSVFIPFGWVLPAIFVGIGLFFAVFFGTVATVMSVVDWASTGFWKNPYKQLPWVD